MQTQTIHYIPPVARTTTTLRVAAYARVSSDSADQLESYAAQVEHYEQLISNHPGWELVDIYADEGLTGTRADTREEFQRLLKDCRRGRIDKVLTKSISRFARNTRDTLTSIRELKALGVEVFFEKERLDTGAMSSELMLSFYGAAAQEESLSISGNMRWSYQRRMKSGEFICCKPPYGYTLSGSDTLNINVIEAPIVKRIFNEYLSGMSIADIAEQLEREQVPRTYYRWTRHSIELLLRNERYTGNALLQKTYTTSELPFRKVQNKGETTMYYLENSHQAIISSEAFEQVQRLMKQRYVSKAAKTYAFTKKIRCAICGYNFRRKACNGKTYWVCNGHFRSKDNCPIKQIPEPVFEQAFVRLHNKLSAYSKDILHPMLEQLITLRQRAAFQHGRLAEIDNEILNLGRQSMLLHRLYGAGHMEAVHYCEQSQGLNNQVNILRRKRQLLIDDERDDDAVERTRELLDTLKNGPETLAEFEADCFNGIVDHIMVPSQNELVFHLSNGLCVTERI